MSAYIVFTREKTIDQAELDAYAVEVKPALATFGMQPLAVYGEHRVFEGPEVEGVVIMEFATTEDATSWYQSPAYQAACQHRFKGAEYRCVLVAGV